MKTLLKNKMLDFVLNSHWYNNVMFKDCRKFWELGDSVFEVVNLGSTSGVFDFDYSGLTYKGANWAVGPQSIYGDFAVLRQYRKHLKNGATVIYPLCPFTSISGAEEYVDDRCYSFLDYNLIPNAHYLRLSKIKQIKDNPISYYPLSSLKIDIKLGLFGNRVKEPICSEQYLKKDAENILNAWKRQFQLVDLSQPFEGHLKDIYDKGVVLLREMVTFCKSNNLKLVIVIPPMHKSLSSLFSMEARKNLIDSFILESIESSVPYYNLMEDQHFSDDSSLFRSSYYLNQKGAKKFTSYFLNLIS